jgi:hypothetical protein
VFQELGVNKLIPARGADSRNDEDIRKIGDIFGFIQVFGFSIAAGSGARDDCLHLCSTDLVARDLYRHGGKDDIALVAKTDDIAVHVLGHFFSVLQDTLVGDLIHLQA